MDRLGFQWSLLVVGLIRFDYCFGFPSPPSLYRCWRERDALDLLFGYNDAMNAFFSKKKRIYDSSNSKPVWMTSVVLLSARFRARQKVRSELFFVHFLFSTLFALCVGRLFAFRRTLETISVAGVFLQGRRSIISVIRRKNKVCQ